MKTLLVLLTVIVSTTINAEVTPRVQFVGKYKAVRAFGSFGYQNAKDCKTDGGKYSEGLCIFKNGGATVEITKKDNGNYNFSFTSIGTNFHTCDYSGEAKVLNSVQLLSTDAESEYPEGCEVTVAFTSKDKLAVITNGKCSSLCGANMALDEDELKRVKN